MASQAIVSSDPVHRNISDGYCRRSINEYLKLIYIAVSSLGELVSGLHACRQAHKIAEYQFQRLDSLAYKLENGLLKLVERLEQKRDEGGWTDHLIVKESNSIYAKEIPSA